MIYEGSHYVYDTALHLVVRYRDASTFHRQNAGWFYWWQAVDPQGQGLCGVSRGPFSSAEAAYRAGTAEDGDKQA